MHASTIAFHLPAGLTQYDKLLSCRRHLTCTVEALGQAAPGDGAGGVGPRCRLQRARDLEGALEERRVLALPVRLVAFESASDALSPGKARFKIPVTHSVARALASEILGVWRA